MKRSAAAVLALATLLAACGGDVEPADDVELAQYHVVRATAAETGNADAAFHTESPWVDAGDAARAEFAAWLANDEDAAIYREVFAYKGLAGPSTQGRSGLVVLMEGAAEAVLWLDAFQDHASEDQRDDLISEAIANAAGDSDATQYSFLAGDGQVVPDPSDLQRVAYARWIGLLDPEFSWSPVPDGDEPPRTQPLAALVGVPWDEAEDWLDFTCDTFGDEPEYRAVCIAD